MRRPSIVLVVVAGIASVQLVSADCLFVNTNSIPNTVAAFSVGGGGTPMAVPGSPFATGADGGFTADADSMELMPAVHRLYVTNGTGFGFAEGPGSKSVGGGAPGGTAGTVSGFNINPDCTLSTIPGSPWAAESAPTGIASSPDGTRLYVADFESSAISVYAIAADGSLSPLGFSPVGVAATPFDLQMSPDGSLLFASQDAPGAVGVYAVAGDGSLTPVSGSPFPAGGAEHGLTLNPAATHLYVADDGNASVSGYSIGGGGVLTPLAGSPFTAGNEPIEVLTNPSDHVLFVANNSSSNLSVFAIAGDGTLTEIGGSPFPSDSTGPAGLVTDPSGRYLYVANGGFLGGGSPTGSDDVSVYTIASNGALAPISGSPFPTSGNRGGAMGIAYLGVVAGIPTLGGPGLLAFAGLLAVSAAWILLRRRVRA